MGETSRGLDARPGDELRRIGAVIHPSRDVSGPLAVLTEWATGRGIEVGQVLALGEEPTVAPAVSAEDCDLLVAIGGDGTILGALRAAAPAGRTVLGVAYGSLGALATTRPDGLGAALDAVAGGRSERRAIPALEVRPEGQAVRHALNDLVIVRAGAGQVTVRITVDGQLYAAFAGDGLIASTQGGSSAYTFAAGGPLLAPGADAWVLTPLAPHGGSVRPLVLGAGSTVRIEVDPGFGGARTELDGQPATLGATDLALALRADHATLVEVGDEEALLAGLRRRGIVADSPRVVAREAREREARGG